MPKLLLLALVLGIAFNSLPDIGAHYLEPRATADNSGAFGKDNSVVDEPRYSFTTVTPPDNNDDAGDELTGFPLGDLDEQGLKNLMDLEDEIFFAQADVHVAKMQLLEDDYFRNGTQGATDPPRRRKRIWPVVVGIGLRAGARYLAKHGVRHLFKKFARGTVSRSGSRLTTQYAAKGTYRNALGDFGRLLPTKVTRFSNPKGIRGLTGRVGNHKVTVRTGSKGPNSRPTLDIRSHNGKVVRKFRYDKN